MSMLADLGQYKQTVYHIIQTVNDPRKKPVEYIVGKGKKGGNQIQFSPFYTPVKDGTYYVITVAGGRAASPILCLEHISKTMLATVMKLHGWIDLIKAECSAQEP